MSDTALDTRFVSAGESPGLALWQATNRWQAVMRAALAPHKITHVQYVLLACLVWLHGTDPTRQITQADLADFATTDVMMTSQVLRVLETKGLIDRRQHPSDGRARSLYPTIIGITTANRATIDVENTDTKFFTPLHDTTTFRSELTRLGQDQTHPDSRPQPR